MITELEHLAGQIRQLSREDRKQLFNLIPELRDDDRRPLHKHAIEFKSQNISVDAYIALPDDDKLKVLDRAEEENSLWVEQKLKDLHAMWMMVVDGEVVAHGKTMNSFPSDQEFYALCERLEKYPFVFFHPSMFVIEESASPWHQTSITDDDYYPVVSLEILGSEQSVTVDADFDSGAWEIYADLAHLIAARVIALDPRDLRRTASHLSTSFQYFSKRLALLLIDAFGITHRIERNVICVSNWRNSPFCNINPRRTALIGRAPLLDLKPKVELDFGQHVTTVRY